MPRLNLPEAANDVPAVLRKCTGSVLGSHYNIEPSRATYARASPRTRLRAVDGRSPLQEGDSQHGFSTRWNGTRGAKLTPASRQGVAALIDLVAGGWNPADAFERDPRTSRRVPSKPPRRARTCATRCSPYDGNHRLRVPNERLMQILGGMLESEWAGSSPTWARPGLRQSGVSIPRFTSQRPGRVLEQGGRAVGDPRSGSSPAVACARRAPSRDFHDAPVYKAMDRPARAGASPFTIEDEAQ